MNYIKMNLKEQNLIILAIKAIFFIANIGAISVIRKRPHK